MNDHPPLEPVGDASLEARIVAWVLGEATAFEAGELERLCDERPELLVFRRRMRALHGLLSEAESAEADEAWKLPPDKRAKIEELFGESTPEQDIPILRPTPPSRSLLKPGRLHQRRRSEGQSTPSRWFAKTILTAAACVMFGMLYRFGFDATKSSSSLAVNEKSVDFMSYGSAGGSAGGGGVEIIGGSGFVVPPASPIARQVESSRSLVEKDLQAGQKQNLQASDGGFSYKTKAAQAVADTESLAAAAQPKVEDTATTDAAPPELPNSVAFSGRVLDRTADPFAANGGAVDGDADPFASAPAQKAMLAARKPVYEPKPGEANGKRVFAEGAVSNMAIPDPGDNFGEMSSLSSFERDKGGGGLGAGSGGGFGANDDRDGRRVEIEGESASRDGVIRREIPVTPATPTRGLKNDLAAADRDTKDGAEFMDISGRVRGYLGDESGSERANGFGGGTGGAMLEADEAVLPELTKNGVGSLELSGGNTYNGRTKATAGVLGIEGTDRGEMADSAKGEKPPIGEDQGARSILTGGLRSGDDAVNRNRIDGLLSQTDRSNLGLADSQSAQKPGEPTNQLAEFQSLKRAMPAAGPAPAAVAPQKSDAAEQKMLSDGIVWSDPESPKETSADLGFDGKLAAKEDATTPLSDLAQREMIRRQALSGDNAVDQLASRRSEELKKIDKTWELTDTKDPAPTAMFESPIRGNNQNGGRLEKENEPTSSAESNDLGSLQKSLKEQEDRVEERRKLLTTIVRTKGIIPSGDGSLFRNGSSEDDRGAGSAKEMEFKIEQDKIQIESQLKSLENYTSEQLLTYASGIDLPENVIKTLYPQYLEQKRTLDRLKSQGLSDNHPTVVSQKQNLENLNKQLEEGTASLRDTLKAQGDMATERLAKVRILSNEKKASAIDMAVDAQDYINAKKALEAENAKLNALRLRLIDSKGKEPIKVPAKPAPVPTDELSANAEAFSTFSLHVSDASFKVAKAALDRGERPDPESVRPEEFYNAFDYGDPTPAPGEPVACAIEQAAHPILPQRNLVRVAMRTGAAGRAASQPLNLTVLLDHSGSMEREDRHEGLNQAIVQLASLLKAGDTITVAGFSRTPRLMADRLPGERAKELIDIVRNTPSEGGTNLEEALKLGGDLALRQKNPAAQNRIVLLTDGAANLGNAKPEDLAERIRALRQQGISFDAAGLGAGGVNDRMLETLTRDGNGRYYLIDQPSDADANFAKQLAGAFRPAAENVKVQVHFNPARVGRYKLIGFEKHRLKTEDFRNDKVDAAELAAEEAGVALYQVETLPQGTGEIGEASVRFKDTSTGQMVEQTWTIPYDEKAAAFDQAAPSMQLASLAALAAEKLRGGPLAEATDFQSLTPQVAKVRAHYSNSKKVGDLIEMIGKLK